MDEILIEDKKYVSSKRAAKMTGYAKDYIGQLCREGRVPARFVGRNWYVLEAAIQDHRFGPGESNVVSDIEPIKATETIEEKKMDVIPPTWESPRYEAISADVLPSINQMRTTNVEINQEEQEGKETVESNLDESWRAWFNNFDNKTPETVSAEIEKQGESIEKEEENEEQPVETPVREVEIEKDVAVPIHTIYELPPEELLPRHNEDYKKMDEPEYVEPRLNTRFIRSIKISGILLSIILVTVAIFGSGYLDKYISASPFSIIAGVVLYNK